MKQLNQNSINFLGKSASILGDFAQASFTRNKMDVFGAVRLFGSALALMALFAFSPAKSNNHLPAGFVSASGMAENEWICQLPAPTYFSAERTGTSTAYLEWTAVHYAAAYSLMVYDLSTFELVHSSVVSGTSTIVDGLQSEKTYRCLIAAICSGGSTSSFIIVEDILD